MKLTIDAAALGQAIGLASDAVSSRPSRPILSCLLLEAGGDQLKITGFDETLGITATSDAVVEQVGEVCVDAKIFGDIINKLQGQVSITLKETQLSLETLGSRFSLATLPALDYPAIEQADPDSPIQLSAEKLQEYLNFCRPTMSDDETKQVLTGIHASNALESLEFAATDGHRLSVYSSEPVTSVSNFELTIPAKTIKPLTAMLKGQEQATLFIDRVFIQVEVPGYRLISRILEGQYPDYRRLIPSSYATAATLDRKLALKSLERIAVAAAMKNNIVKLQITESCIDISVDGDSVSGTEQLPVLASGALPIQLAFNVKYLLDAIAAFKEPEVTIQMNTPTSPAVIRGSTPDRTVLLMPVQVR